MVQGMGFEPMKHYAPELKSGPFDQLGYPCELIEPDFQFQPSGKKRAITDALYAPTSRTL